jgi:hypothetical protein
MPQAGVSVSTPRSRRRVQAWLDWSEDELWVSPRPRASVASDRGPVASERRPPTAERPPRARAAAALARDRSAAPPARDRSAAPPARDRFAAPPPRRAAEPRHEASRSTAPAAPLPPLRESPAPPAGRRTITITGHGDDRRTGRAAVAERSRPQRRPHERPGYRPDRIALYAVLLGVVLVLVAATSSHAATRRPAHARPAAQVSVAKTAARPAASARP